MLTNTLPKIRYKQISESQQQLDFSEDDLNFDKSKANQLPQTPAPSVDTNFYEGEIFDEEPKVEIVSDPHSHHKTSSSALLIPKTRKINDQSSGSSNFGNKEPAVKKSKNNDHSLNLRKALKTVILKKKENTRPAKKKETSSEGRGCECGGVNNLFGPCGMRLCESIKQQEEKMSRKNHSKASSISTMPSIKGSMSINNSASNMKFSSVLSTKRNNIEMLK